MLHKSRFVAKSVVAVFSHAMEMGLVFAIIATRKSTILIESEIETSEQKLTFLFEIVKRGVHLRIQTWSA